METYFTFNRLTWIGKSLFPRALSRSVDITKSSFRALSDSCSDMPEPMYVTLVSMLELKLRLDRNTKTNSHSLTNHESDNIAKSNFQWCDAGWEEGGNYKFINNIEICFCSSLSWIHRAEWEIEWSERWGEGKLKLAKIANGNARMKEKEFLPIRMQMRN